VSIIKKMSIKNIFSNLSSDGFAEYIEKNLTRIIYSIILLLVVVFMVICVLQRRENNKRTMAINYYDIALYAKDNDDKFIGALRNIYSSKQIDDNLKTISGLRLAELLYLNGDVDKSIEIGSEIYALKHNDVFLRNLAGLVTVSRLINRNDEKYYATIDKMLDTLAKKDNPVFILATEQKGMFEIQRGNQDFGVSILKELLKSSIDVDTRNRLETVVAIYH